ncbi:tyrosine-protein phosphatase [Gordonia amicalis]|uniref:tyrosine-protein phosphatase n=1 Tax=Gordonia amicalis TaxID=89053 RepID=UPI0004271503|nr:tyrosine-protein phosphatase [Gordonia amicalis]MCZ4650579.1 tyrosine-protein phosphatase [Gordonia amicalis]
MPATTLPNRPNFRSLAGLPTTDGRHVRENVLYRSESLADLGEDDRQALEALGIKSVCDLRSDGERAAHPLVWPGEQPHLVPVETLPDARVAGPELIGRIMKDVEGGTLVEILTGNAKDMPGAFVNSMKIIFDSIIDDEQIPLLVKCVAGKDRTGFVIANILKALDVQWDAIVEDYLASGRNIDKNRLHGSMMEYVEDPSGEVLSADRLVDLGSQAAYLEASFAAIERDFGSYEDYLVNVCGLTPARHERLKDLLLD